MNKIIGLITNRACTSTANSNSFSDIRFMVGSRSVLHTDKMNVNTVETCHCSHDRAQANSRPETMGIDLNLYILRGSPQPSHVQPRLFVGDPSMSRCHSEGSRVAYMTPSFLRSRPRTRLTMVWSLADTDDDVDGKAADPTGPPLGSSTSSVATVTPR